MTATALERALSLLRDAMDAAEAAIEAETDPMEAYRMATELTEAFREACIQVARLRAVAAKRIKEQESLSLRALAGRLAVSYPVARDLAIRGEAEEVAQR